MDKLQEIIAHKRTEIAKILPLEEKYRHEAALRNDFRSLYRALDLGPEHALERSTAAQAASQRRTGEWGSMACMLATVDGAVNGAACALQE